MVRKRDHYTELSKQRISEEGQFVRTCSIWRALNVVGDVASLLVLQAIWMQQSKFSEMVVYTRLPKAVLSNRLQRLVESGVISKDTVPKSAPYRLSAKGLDLFNVVMMLLRWESRWNAEGNLEVTLIHKGCGKPMVPVPGCAGCHAPFSADDIRFEAGDGIGLMNPVYQRRRQSKSKLGETDEALLFTQSADILGDRWSALVLRSIFTGLVHHDQIKDDLAIATNILGDRLRWLMSIEMIELSSDSPKEYWLTTKGKDFVPVLTMLQAWGDEHCASPEGPPVVVSHSHCGNPLRPIVTCDQCGAEVLTTDTELSIKITP